MSIIEDDLFNSESLKLLEEQSPGFKKALENSTITINITKNYGGNNLTDNRSIGDVNIEGHNNNVMGDHNNLTNTTGTDIAQANKAYEKLLTEIQDIQDESIRTVTNNVAVKLKEAIDQKDSEKGKKLISMIQGAIGTVGSLTTIAKFFGLTL
ncbi:hypothetical protein [Bacillus altitudinis]|uniref:hypothetical protein n=1 Tax=Bacillus altitudinis TaxID=293387 RepID=UPI00202089D0|nr:hypothetical protein [Bacillus altitudinis]MCL7873792.1 hypothetical protein [Bacillus altitudinis]